MKKIAVILILAALLTGSESLLAAETKKAENSGVTVTQAPKETVFSHLSDYFSSFDRAYTRRGNKQGFWNATADWVRNINKE